MQNSQPLKDRLKAKLHQNNPTTSDSSVYNQPTKLLETLNGDENVVTRVATLPNGQVVSGNLDDTLKIWDVEMGKSLDVQGRGPSLPAPTFQSPMIQGQVSLCGTSQGRGAPLLSGSYRQAQGQVPTNNNNQDQEATEATSSRKFG